MVISVINGGFANQLYRYACAYATAKKYNQELIIIVQTTDAGTDPFQLGEFRLEYSELYIVENHMQEAVLLEDWKDKYRLREVREGEYLSVISHEIFRQFEGVILYGTYQNQIFFREYIDDLRSMLKFEDETLFLAGFKEEIVGKQSVAVHVRRGDFLTYESLCRGMEFYKAAMCVMEDKIGYGLAEYYIFSDDKEFVRTYFGRNKRIHYIQVYGDYWEAVEEFLALSLCNHRILTVASSFSRMADALNADPDGYTIYEQAGFGNMVFSRDNLLYLDQQMIRALVDYYAPLFDRDVAAENILSEKEIRNLGLATIVRLSMDTRDIKKESELLFRIRKIELLNERGQYSEALGQVRKLWELAVGTEFEHKMHELYWECLYEYGYRAESMVEATFLMDMGGELAQCYDVKEQEMIEVLRSARESAEVVIIPSRSFDPCVFEDMIHTGVILKRLGYHITFMFWEPSQESEYYQPYTKTLRERSFFEDVMGHNSWCKMVNLTEKENEFQSLSSFFRYYFRESERVVLLARQKKVIVAVGESGLSGKILTVYWDGTNIFDLGNYKGLAPQNYGVSFLSQELTQEEKQECQERADYCITFDGDILTGKPVVVLKGNSQQFFEPKKSRLIADYYRISPITIENTYAIISNIISKCQSDRESGDIG